MKRLVGQRVRWLGLALLLTILLVPFQAVAKQEDLRVMTRNLYIGLDLLAVAEAPDFIGEAQAALGIAAASYRERVATLAAEIAEQAPHLVALQEVYDFTFNDQNFGPPFPFVDFLDELLGALQSRGAMYQPVAAMKNTDIAIPLTLPMLGAGTVRVIDRDVILRRADVAASPVDLTGLCRTQADWDGCNYGLDISFLPIPNPPVLPNPADPEHPIVIERGLVAAYALFDGQPLVFVNTHLEVRELGMAQGLPVGFYQSLQALELVEILDVLSAELQVPILVGGDFNSSSQDNFLHDFGAFVLTPPYRQMAAGGFLDAWVLHRPGEPDGFTCCQEENLLNQRSALYERIDLIFSSEEPRQVKVHLSGNKQADKSPAGLWPSDHAGVTARLDYGVKRQAAGKGGNVVVAR